MSSILAEREIDLRRELDRARANIGHSGERGGQLEHAFRGFIDSHLSSGFSVGHGEVFDLAGRRSRQTDVLVLNQYQPFRSPMESDRAASYIIEGVSAAGEVKAVLTKSAFSDAIDKGLAFRTVRSTSDVGDRYPNAQIEDLERHTISPPYFLFAYSSEIADETMIAMLEAMPSATLADDTDGGASTTSPAIDAIFLLDRRIALMNTWRNTGKIRKVGESDSVWSSRANGFVVTSYLFWLYAMMTQADRVIPPALKYFMKLMDDGT